jgi:hypothetical protein
MSRKKKTVKQYTTSGLFVKMYDSVKSASVTLNIDSTSISKCCNFDADTAGGFRFEFKEN